MPKVNSRKSQTVRPGPAAMAANSGKREALNAAIKAISHAATHPGRGPAARYVLILDTAALSLTRQLRRRIPDDMEIHVVERDRVVHADIREQLATAGIANVTLHHGDINDMCAAPPPAGSWAQWCIINDGWGGTSALTWEDASDAPAVIALTVAARSNRRGNTVARRVKRLKQYAKRISKRAPFALTHALGHRTSSSVTNPLAKQVMMLFILQRTHTRQVEYSPHRIVAQRSDGQCLVKRFGFPRPVVESADSEAVRLLTVR